MVRKPRSYVPAIDLLRCFAALIVMLFHLGSVWPHVMLPISVLPPYPDISRNGGAFFFGYVGVEIFFVISGFVIASSCRGRTPSEFFVGRALRILPLLWIVTLAEVAIHLVGHATVVPTLVAAFKSMTLWPNGGWLNTVVWTLVLESVFYSLIWASLAMRVDTDRALVGIAWALALASSLFQLFCTFVHAPAGFLPTFLLLRHGMDFALGIAIWSHANGRRGLLPLFLVTIPAGLLEIYNQNTNYASETHHFYPWALPAAIWLAAIAVVIHASARPSTQLKPWIRTAGLVTFPIYLVHKTCGAWVVAIAYDAGLPGPAAIGTGIVVTVLVAWGLVQYVEPVVRPAFKAALQAIARVLNLGRFVPQRA